MKRCILKIFTLLVFSSLILSCSGGEKDSGLQEEYQKVDYTLGESSKVVKPEDAAGIVGVDEEGTIVFEADSALASSLKQNDVLLIGLGPKTPEGLLRRVNEIAEDKGQVVVKTSQASMEEAFSNLELSMFKNLQPAEVKQYSSSVEGLSFIQAPLTGEAGYEFKTGFDNTVLYDLDKNLSTKHDQVVANGNLSFFAGLKVDIEIDWFSLKRFSAGILIKQEGELEISSGIGVSLSKEIKVAEFYFAPMAVGPVVITPTIEIVVGIDGELSAKMVARVSQSVKADAGIVWESSKWGKYGSADWDFTYLPPSAEIEASVKGYAGVNLTTKIYGVAGPFGGVNGYLKYIVTPINTPWWRLYAGIEGKIGAKVEFLSFKLTEFSIKVYEGG
ncbi:MAG: hypothetical protein FJ088_04115, partial [Deltaproteobacteria bacterium]|nr:hypothetical protein [Deltaproteobacteria bacterium]